MVEDGWFFPETSTAEDVLAKAWAKMSAVQMQWNVYIKAWYKRSQLINDCLHPGPADTTDLYIYICVCVYI